MELIIRPCGLDRVDYGTDRSLGSVDTDILLIEHGRYAGSAPQLRK
jgi:hypothetical protein